MRRSNERGAQPRALLVGALAAAAMFAPGAAQAHFRLMTPTQWIVEGDSYGDPQKAAPCGVDSTVTYTPSNVVTTFAPGQKITLTWIETIPHDGWYRIALAKNRADLKDPPYSADAFGTSTDAGIERPPVAPVLVDGLFPHTIAQITTPKTYTYELTLPNTPCQKCTLQVIQYMNNHPYNNPGGYFYHHCADISIVPGGDGGASVVADAGKVRANFDASASGEPTGDDASSTSDDASSEGTASGTSASDDASETTGAASASDGGSSGGCSSAGPSNAPSAVGVASLLALAALSWRRRRPS